MSIFSNKTFEINFQEDFDNIPIDKNLLTIKIPYNNKSSYFLDNLPVFLQEIHFDNENYMFNEILDYDSNNKITQLDNKVISREYRYKVKIPFGCKIYKLKEPILNFDGLIKIYLKSFKLNFNHPYKELMWTSLYLKNM